MGTRTVLAVALQAGAKTTALRRSAGTTSSETRAPPAQITSTLVFSGPQSLKLTSTSHGQAGRSTMVPVAPSSPLCRSMD